MGEPPPFGLPVCHHILPRCFPCCKKDMQCRDSSRETRAGNGCPASAWEPMRWTFFAVNSPGYPVKVLVLGFVRPTAVFFFRLALTKLFFFGPQKVCLHGFEVFFVSPQRPWVQRKKKKKKKPIVAFFLRPNGDCQDALTTVRAHGHLPGRSFTSHVHRQNDFLMQARLTSSLDMFFFYSRVCAGLHR